MGLTYVMALTVLQASFEAPDMAWGLGSKQCLRRVERRAVAFGKYCEI